MVQENDTGKLWWSRGTVPTPMSCAVGHWKEQHQGGCSHHIDAVRADRKDSTAGIYVMGGHHCKGYPRSGLQSLEGSVWEKGCFQVSTPQQ